MMHRDPYNRRRKWLEEPKPIVYADLVEDTGEIVLGLPPKNP